MSVKKYILITALFACAAFARGEKEPWSNLETVAREHLVNLIALDTSQPEGNEIDAARYIYKVFNKYNIDWDIYQPEKNRASISAVIKGKDAKKPPLMLLSHLDTVSAVPGWTKPPFKAVFEDGKIYGLGSADDKNFTAVFLTIFTWLKKNNITPERDIIFLAAADEEAGGAKGLNWLINSGAWEKIKPGYALNEGGSVIIEPGRKPLLFTEAAAKMYMDIKITAFAPGGHAAGKSRDNAVYNLSQALAKLELLKMPFELTPFVRKFFEQLLPFQDEDARTTIEILLGQNKAEAEMAAEIIAEDQFFRTQLQDTCTPTVLASGSDANVSSEEASAVLNCRLLPATDPGEFAARIKKLFEGNDNIFVEVLDNPKTPFPLPHDGSDELYAAITGAGDKVFGETAHLLGMSPTSSDSEFLRREGVITYGIGAPADIISYEGVAHSADEHIAEESFYKQLRFFANIIFNFAVKAGGIEEYIDAD